MGIIFDAVFLLLIAVLVMTGVHRGVARSLLGLAGVLLAGFLAGSLSQPVAGWVYDASLKNVLLDGLTQAIGSNTGGGYGRSRFFFLARLVSRPIAKQWIGPAESGNLACSER